MASLTDRDAVERLGQLRQAHLDVGNYLYVFGRCALAHTKEEPIFNPDDQEHHERLVPKQAYSLASHFGHPVAWVGAESLL